MTTRFILVRHGESTWNSEERIQGWLDPPLSQRGVQQAELVGERLRTETIDAVYASPQERARATAEHIARHHALPVQLDDRLREQFLGALQGLTTAEIASRFPERTASYRSSPLWSRVADEESVEQLSQRVCGCCCEMIERHHHQTVVVVSHGGALNRLLIT
ncbi:MAG: histidine phosphatase family protein, partial [Chloroflexi bacterium]|nr:histidine phosphatase family protein [Chloroflexota bacterium]